MSGPSSTSPANATPTWAAYTPSGAIKAGAQATTAGAVVLPTVAFNGQVTLKAPKANAASIALGPAGVTLTTGLVLDPGDQITLPLSNLNLLYLIGANTTDHITWLGL